MGLTRNNSQRRRLSPQFKLYSLEILRVRGRRVLSDLFCGHERLVANTAIVRAGFADHPANSFAALAAIDRGRVVAVNLRGRASARRNRVVHLRRVQTPAHTDDHANDLQQFATDCQSPCNSHARRQGAAGEVPEKSSFSGSLSAPERSRRLHVPCERSSVMIRKLASGGYRLYSRRKDPKTGKRRNLGTFKTKAAAQKHEREVQYFKRAG